MSILSPDRHRIDDERSAKMPAYTRPTVTLMIVGVLLVAAVLAGDHNAAAERNGPELTAGPLIQAPASVTINQFYTRTLSKVCAAGGSSCDFRVGDQAITVRAKCDTGDQATGGYGWRRNDTTGAIVTPIGVKSVGNPPIGFDITVGTVPAGHRDAVTVICADLP
jgi:hypothetical protein